MIREPVQAGAGKFYPDDPEKLKNTIESFIDQRQEKKDVKALVMPHAGYVYSGKVAGKAVSCAKIKKTVVILAPNHTGLGTPFSLMATGTWKTPLGLIDVDETFARQLIKKTTLVSENIGEGSHTFTWNAEDQPSGVYFYRLTGENFSQTRKMLLVR